MFAVATLSCVFLLGQVGLLSFGQGLFFGIGAYVSAVLLKEHEVGTLPAIAAGAVVACLGAALLGLLAVRRQGVYFVMLTLAFAQMGYFAMLALRNVTGGENGLTGVPRPPLIAGFGALVGSGAVYALLATLAFIAFLFVQRVADSPFGSVLRAIRQNEARAEALGYDVRRFKTAAFALACWRAWVACTPFSSFSRRHHQLEMSERRDRRSSRRGACCAFVGAGFYVVMADVLSALWPLADLIGFLLIAIVLFLRGGLWAASSRLRGLDRTWLKRCSTREVAFASVRALYGSPWQLARCLTVIGPRCRQDHSFQHADRRLTPSQDASCWPDMM